MKYFRKPKTAQPHCNRIQKVRPQAAVRGPPAPCLDTSTNQIASGKIYLLVARIVGAEVWRCLCYVEPGHGFGKALICEQIFELGHRTILGSVAWAFRAQISMGRRFWHGVCALPGLSDVYSIVKVMTVSFQSCHLHSTF